MYSYGYFHKRCWIFKCLSHPQVLLSNTALSDFSQSILVSGIVPIQVQYPALWLVKLHQVLIDPFPRFFLSPLDDIPSFCCVSCTAQLVTPAILLRVYSTSLWHWWRYWAPVPGQSPEDTTRYWPPPGHKAIYHDLLAVSIQLNNKPTLSTGSRLPKIPQKCQCQFILSNK